MKKVSQKALMKALLQQTKAPSTRPLFGEIVLSDKAVSFYIKEEPKK